MGEGPYRVYACAILPEHVAPRDRRQLAPHPRGGRSFREVARRMFCGSSSYGTTTGRSGEAHGWNVYLESVAAVERAIRYVNGNPLKEGKRPQNWSFVVPFVEREALPNSGQRGGAARRTTATPHRRRGARESGGSASQATRANGTSHWPNGNCWPRRLRRACCRKTEK